MQEPVGAKVTPPTPIRLTGYGVTLEPLAVSHAPELVAAASDGELWNLWFTTVPAPDAVDGYVDLALAGLRDGHMLPWAVREEASGLIIGSTRFHDMVPSIARVEIGYTWYAMRFQRTWVNTACKRLLMGHAFDDLHCEVVGFRTDSLNHRSQRALERLGAKKDGVLRHHGIRKDGSARDTVMYSVLRHEWPDIKRHLEAKLGDRRS